MCEIATATAVVGLVSTIGSAVYGTMGAVRQANAQNAQMEYNAKVSENNARNAQAEADYARAQGWRNANEKRREVAQLIGAQRAKMGASGAVVDSGSFLDLTLSTKEQGELDAMALLNEGRMQAWRSRVQGSNLMAKSNLYKSSKTNPYLAAGGTLLSGAGQAGMNYYYATNGTKVR